MASVFDSLIADAGGLNDACKSTFGEAVTYRCKGTTVDTLLTGILTREAVDQDLGDGQAISTQQIYLCIVTADLPQTPRKGDTCTVDGVAYRVIDPQPESSTRTKSPLERL